MALSVYANKDIQYKQIQFSLDPFDEFNPRGPFQEKVYWPDKTENKRYLKGSEMGDIFFETDFILK